MSDELDFRAVGFHGLISGDFHAVILGIRIIACVPDGGIASRIVELLNTHGLADTADLETTGESHDPDR